MSSEPEFKTFGKIPRLNRDIIITEKIDGTNACVVIEEAPFGTHLSAQNSSTMVFGPSDDTGTPGAEYLVSAQSRNRLITPSDDNFGFAKWVWDNAESLVQYLGEGYHYGEWWGSGIQRGYGLEKGHKRFSLFNTYRWHSLHTLEQNIPGLDVVPVLYNGPFSWYDIDESLDALRTGGSVANYGFMNPEGIIIYHTAARHYFKITLENDEAPKSQIQ